VFLQRFSVDFGADLCLRQRPSVAVFDVWFILWLVLHRVFLFTVLLSFPFAGVHIEWTLDPGRMVVYSTAELYAIYRHNFRLTWLVRKTIISHRQRVRSQRLMRARCHSSQLIRSSYPSLGCVNARSVRNKSSLLCRGIEERQFDVIVVVETWHECSESLTLKRIVPPGYQSLTPLGRPIPPDVH